MYSKYTTVSGVDGFDGTRKEAPKAVVKASLTKSDILVKLSANTCKY
jgi:hypothetical protein